MSNTLDRIVDTAANNLRVAKILTQMGLDPNNITSDALFNRLLEIVLANITLANMFALVGAVFGVGMARGLKALNLQTLKEIVVSWVVTIPLCAILSIVLFYLLKWILIYTAPA